MARPTKSGLDYFPLDTKLSRKLRLLKAKHKLEGIGFIDLLWRAIYSEGYYMILDDEMIMLVSDEFGLTKERFSELLNSCIEIGLFYKPFYDEHQVITSLGIQKRFFHKTTRRTTKGQKFLLYSNDNNDSSEGVSVNRNYSSDDVTDDINATKKRREKETKEKKTNKLLLQA